MRSTRISHESRNPTRQSLASPAPTLIPAADAGATVVGAGLSQRQLLQWSLLLCPHRKKRGDA
jgi:hypothetical protein